MTSDPAPERSYATAPVGDVVIPPAVAVIAGGVVLHCVWRNELGGLTFELPAVGRFLKWAPAGSDLPLLEEATRLRWARRCAPVPEVIDAGTAADNSTWLLTARLRGTSAVDERWKAAPRTAVRAIGEALRAFHEALPVEACPFTWTAEERLGRAQARAAAGTIDPMEWHPSHRHLRVDDAIALVSDPPPVDRLVVCHSDSCSPNTLINDDGSWSGHVDLGRMGIGDRWGEHSDSHVGDHLELRPWLGRSFSPRTGSTPTPTGPGSTDSFGISPTDPIAARVQRRTCAPNDAYGAPPSAVNGAYACVRDAGEGGGLHRHRAAARGSADRVVAAR